MFVRTKHKYIYRCKYRAGGIGLAAPVIIWPDQVFLKIKTNFHFYKKQVANKQSAIVILGLIRLIILS